MKAMQRQRHLCWFRVRIHPRGTQKDEADGCVGKALFLCESGLKMPYIDSPPAYPFDAY
jgi:hypothetical protein